MVEPVAADGPEMALFGDLYFVQPAQGVQAAVHYALLSGGAPGQNQGMGELRIVIR